ncbi:MAG TPA: permease prefix domain 1-containing protein [Pirellulales bacterium]|jgi:hypothetical protein
MSESSRHEDEQDVRRAPDIAGEDMLGGARSQESFDAELEAELADHLASSAAELVRQGESSAKAVRTALANFGDIDRIKRQCWWIHHGEDVMFRASGIALLSILTIGIALLAAGGWQVQRSLATRTEELSSQLASLASTQEAMLAQQRPPQATGRCYLGDPSKPAVDTEIRVFRFADVPQSGNTPGLIARRVRTDARGYFDTGILQQGEYCLLATLFTPDGKTNNAKEVSASPPKTENELLFGRLQSRPLYLMPGINETSVDLDLCAGGRLELAAQNVPDSVTVGEREFRVFVALQIMTDARYFPSQPVPPSDEPPEEGWPLPLPPVPITVAGVSKKASELPQLLYVPSRNYYISVHLMFLSGQGVSPMGEPAYTKAFSQRLDIRSGETSIVTIRVPGAPLESQLQAKFDAGDIATSGPGPFIRKSIEVLDTTVDVNFQKLPDASPQ